MPIQSVHIEHFSAFQLLANEVVEGFLTGLHKSPFHGFSVEFAEHKIYNPGDATKNIDWKLYARTDKLFLKEYEEETNLKCTIAIDVSDSMRYPLSDNTSVDHLNKLGFSLYAAGALLTILGKQRDACGLVTFSEGIEMASVIKGSKRHRNFLFQILEGYLNKENDRPLISDISNCLKEIALKAPKRGLVFIFSDFSIHDESSIKSLIESVQQLKHKNNEVVVFNVMDVATELNFDLTKRPYKFRDLETGEEVKLNPIELKEHYVNEKHRQIKLIRESLLQSRVDFIEVDVKNGFTEVLESYLVNRKKFK